MLTLEDFELLASIANLVAYIYINKIEFIGNILDEWKDYICFHRLPEVRKHADLFESSIDV